MTDCQAFFEQLDRDCAASDTAKIRGQRLREMGEGRLQRLLDWENQAASRYSPGPVESKEAIRKALFNDRDVVDGCLHRNAFLSLDDLGLSADRTEKTTADATRKRFENLASSKRRSLYGYVDLDVTFLRAQTTKHDDKIPNVRAIGVYDTATADNGAHAEAFLIVEFSNTRPKKSVQADLLDKYKSQIKAYAAV